MCVWGLQFLGLTATIYATVAYQVIPLFVPPTLVDASAMDRAGGGLSFYLPVCLSGCLYIDDRLQTFYLNTVIF